MDFSRSVLIVATLTGSLSAGTVQPPQVKPLPIETLLTSKVFGEYSPLAFSPDGRRLAYTLRSTRPGKTTLGVAKDHTLRTGVPWYAIDADIWVLDVESSKARNLTGGAGNNWAPSWSPDGRSLAFLSDRPHGGQSQLARPWIADTLSGSVRLAANANVRSRDVLWSSDGRRLLVTVLPDGISTDAYVERVNGARTPPGPTTPGSTVQLYRSAKRADKDGTIQGGWNLDRPIDLAWIDVSTGSVDRIVRNITVSHIVMSPDGARFAYTTPKRFERAGSQQILFDLTVMEGRTSSVIAGDIRLNYDGRQIAWAPDSAQVAFRTAGMLASGDVYVATLGGAAPRLVTPAPHPKFTKTASAAPLWDRSSKFVYFVDDDVLWRAASDATAATEVAKLEGARVMLLSDRPGQLWVDGANASVVMVRDKKSSACGLRRVDLEKKSVTALQTEDKFYGGYSEGDGVAVSPTGDRLVYAAQDPQHGPDLFLLDRQQLPVRRLSTINPELEAFAMGERRIVEWRSIDGATIRGVLLLPSGYQPGRRYPLIAKIYGGARPSEDYANRFGLQGPLVDNLQIYATRGYAVLLPDLPVGEGTVMVDLMKIVVPGVDKVVELGIADPDRLGVTGHSFGGYNTIALISQTTRFKAAVMSAGLANILSAYGEMSDDGTAYGMAVIEHGQFGIYGTPWDRPARYIENSPIFHLDRVETPLLITHGGADPAVAPFLAAEIFVGLRRLGKEVAYARYDGEDHHQAQWRFANQVDHWTRVIEWFDTYLKPASVPSGSRQRPQ